MLIQYPFAKTKTISKHFQNLFQTKTTHSESLALIPWLSSDYFEPCYLFSRWSKWARLKEPEEHWNKSIYIRLVDDLLLFSLNKFKETFNVFTLLFKNTYRISTKGLALDRALGDTGGTPAVLPSWNSPEYGKKIGAKQTLPPNLCNALWYVHRSKSAGKSGWDRALPGTCCS